VSSFGISGTNAHAILEQAPAGNDQAPAGADAGEGEPAGESGVAAWVVSGRSERAVRAQAARLAEFVRERPGLGAAEVGHALAIARSVLEHRAVVVGADRQELLAGLAALADGRADARVVTGQARGAGRTAFVFAGQGAQRVGMGRQLHARFPVFAAAWDEVCALASPDLPRPLGEVVFTRPGARATAVLERTEFAQPALFAFEVALARLLESWGVRADVVAGHSVGEVAAAHVAGVLSLPDACRMVTARGRLMQALPAGGVMLAVQAAEADMAGVLAEREEWQGRVTVAAVNGPAAVVVAGEEAAAGEVRAVLAGRGVKARRLRVSHAFHSPLMEPMLEDFRRVAEDLSFRAPDTAVVSTVTGRLAAPQDWAQPRYWVEQARSTVRFADAVRELSAQGVSRFVEIGPDGVLSALVDASLPEDHETAIITPVRRDRDEAACVITALAGLHVHGTSPDWAAVFPAAARHGGVGPVELPTYAFQRERYWPRPGGRPADAAALGQAVVDHPLLGAAVELPGSDAVALTSRVSLAAQPWLSDHRVAGVAVLPGTAVVEMAVRARAGRPAAPGPAGGPGRRRAAPGDHLLPSRRGRPGGLDGPRGGGAGPGGRAAGGCGGAGGGVAAAGCGAGGPGGGL
jgi:acyl transferase domain-containing protein